MLSWNMYSVEKTDNKLIKMNLKIINCKKSKKGNKQSTMIDKGLKRVDRRVTLGKMTLKPRPWTWVVAIYTKSRGTFGAPTKIFWSAPRGSWHLVRSTMSINIFASHQIQMVLDICPKCPQLRKRPWIQIVHNIYLYFGFTGIIN